MGSTGTDCGIESLVHLREVFQTDMQEAFEFWQAGQVEKAPSPEVKAIVEEYTIEKWATDILGAQVYDLLRKKRVAYA